MEQCNPGLATYAFSIHKGTLTERAVWVIITVFQPVQIRFDDTLERKYAGCGRIRTRNGKVDVLPWNDHERGSLRRRWRDARSKTDWSSVYVRTCTDPFLFLLTFTGLQFYFQKCVDRKITGIKVIRKNVKFPRKVSSRSFHCTSMFTKWWAG